MRRNFFKAAGGGGGALLDDTFTDVDGTALQDHPPEVGGPWEKLQASGVGIWITTSNKAVNTNPGYATYAPIVVDVGESDVTITSTLFWGTGLTGFCLRGGNEANPTFLYAVFISGTISVYYWNGTAFSLLSAYNGGYSAGNTFDISIVLQGSSIKVSVDSVERLNFASTINQTNTKHGLAASNGSNSFDYILIEQI